MYRPEYLTLTLADVLALTGHPTTEPVSVATLTAAIESFDAACEARRAAKHAADVEWLIEQFEAIPDGSEIDATARE